MISINDLLKDSSLNPLLMHQAEIEDYGPNHQEVNPKASFVASLYTSVLNRAPTPQELTSGMNFIDATVGKDEEGNAVKDPNAKNILLQDIFKQGQNDPNSNAYGARSVSFGGLYEGDRDADGNPISNGDLLFKNKDGSEVGVDSTTGKAIAARAPFSTYSGTGMSSSSASNYNWNGQNVPVPNEIGPYTISYKSDQNGNIYLDANGDPVIAQRNLGSSGGGFGDWMTENGWMLPVAMGTAGAGLYALGGEAAAGGLAAGTAGETGAGSGLAAGTAGEVGANSAGDVFAGLSASAPVDTAASQAAAASLAPITAAPVADTALAAPDVFSGLSANAPVDTTLSQTAATSLVPEITSNPVTPEMVAAANASSDPIGMMSYLTSATPEELAAATGPGAGASSQLADALKTANQVRQVASTANTLSKLLTQGSTGGAAGAALTGAAQNLATGQTGVGMAIPALLRGNQNPFLQTAEQPIRSASPDLASLAQLLKQG